MFMRRLMWIAVNVPLAYFLYLWCFNEVTWAGNIVKFTVFSMFVIAVLLTFIMQRAVDEASEPSKSAFGKVIGISYDLAFVVVLAAFGFFGYAGMHLYSTIIAATYQAELDKKFKAEVK